MMLPAWRAMIFDVDGTLYNSMKVRAAMAFLLARRAARSPVETYGILRLLRAYRRALESFRASPVSLSSIDEAQLAIACRSVGFEPGRARELIHDWFEVAPLSYLGWARAPGLVDLLRTARARGILLGVFSDYPADAKLRSLGVREYFSVVLSARDPRIQAPKPSPVGLLRAAQALGVKPTEAVYVGDRPSVNYPTARAAGMGSINIGRSRGTRSPEGQVRSLKNLEALIARLPSQVPPSENAER